MAEWMKRAVLCGAGESVRWGSWGGVFCRGSRLVPAGAEGPTRDGINHPSQLHRHQPWGPEASKNIH